MLNKPSILKYDKENRRPIMFLVSPISDANLPLAMFTEKNNYNMTIAEKEKFDF